MQHIGHHYSFSTFPYATLGRTLKTGQYIQYPVGCNASNNDRHSITNFFHSILHAVGKEGVEFGTNGNSLLGDIDQVVPLPALMA